MLCGQVRPLAGLCNHLWAGGVTGCVPWQGSATSETLWCTGLQAGLHNFSWLGGTSGCTPWPDGTTGYAPKLGRATGWIHKWVGPWLCSAVVQGHCLGSLAGQGHQLYPAVGWGWKLYSMFEKDLVQALGWVGLPSMFCDLVGPLSRQSLLGQVYRLCSTIGQDHRLGSAVEWGCRLDSTGEWTPRLPKVTLQASRLCRTRSYA